MLLITYSAESSLECLENQYREGDVCKNCPPRKVSPAGSVGANACYHYCQEMQYETHIGCAMCPSGFRSNAGSRGQGACQFVRCPANTYYRQLQDKCDHCRYGKKNPAGSLPSDACK